MNSMKEIKDVEEVARAFSIKREDMGVDEDMLPAVIDNGIATMVLPVKNKEVLLNLNPKRRRMEELAEKYDCLTFHLFHYDSERGVAEQRNFSPAIGIWEESATGTGSGAMYYYLKAKNKLAKEKLVANQGRKIGRPSEIFVHSKNERIYVGGTACIVMEGILRI